MTDDIPDIDPASNGSSHGAPSHATSNGASANGTSSPGDPPASSSESASDVPAGDVRSSPSEPEASNEAPTNASAFSPLTIGALYPGISRGLTADAMATQSLSGTPHPICTSHVVAGRGVVTDVLTVPTDTVSSQLEHVFNTESPTGAKVGILSDAATVDIVFRHLEAFDGPVIFDVTLSGPSGEDVVGQRALDATLAHLSEPDLVTLRLVDATLLAGMEVPSLDDAQVAIQRIAQRGARKVLLRCGRLPTHYFDTDAEPPPYAVDLYYDGEDILLYEAPFLEGLQHLHGKSSGLLLPLLKRMQHGDPIEKGLQVAKRCITDALREAQPASGKVEPHRFFQALSLKDAMDLPNADQS